jgi:hypothetical protein
MSHRPENRGQTTADKNRGLPRFSLVQLLQQLLGNFVEEGRRHAVARLTVQHAGLRTGKIKPLAGAGHGDVHQPALLLQPSRPWLTEFSCGKQPLLQPGDEDDVEFQPLGGMHRHQLHRLLPLAGLVLAGFQRGVREEGGQRPAFGRWPPLVVDEVAAALISSSRFSSRSWPSFSCGSAGQPDFSMTCSMIRAAAVSVSCAQLLDQPDEGADRLAGLAGQARRQRCRGWSCTGAAVACRFSASGRRCRASGN